MGVTRGFAVCWLCWGGLLAGLVFARPVAAQPSRDDAAARAYFERGRTAFDQADYEASLIYFRHAYRLSRRGELQYNIGVAADRLQREHDALEAFERYLAEAESPAREAEVRERIHALRQSIAERQATERALAEATSARRETGEGQTDGRARIGKAAIIGSSALATLGVAGLAAMSVGLARDGSCSRELGGRCVTEHSATGWTWVYGGVGLAALAGSATWLVLNAKRRRTRAKTEVSLSPLGLRVSRKF